MLNKLLNKFQNQNSGDNCINNQSQQIIQHIYQGITIEQVREIALQVFHDNMPKLSKEANDLAKERASYLTDRLIGALTLCTPSIINNFSDPDLQYSLTQAQIAYARSGDMRLVEILVDILIKRASSNEDLEKIVLNETLAVLPKLTSAHLDILALIFTVVYTKSGNVVSIEDLIQYLNNAIFPVLEDIKTESSHYQHLEYAGCGSMKMSQVSVSNVLRENYTGLFCKGFPMDKIESIDTSERLKKLVIPCIHNKSMYQFNAIALDVLIDLAQKAGLDSRQIAHINALVNSNLMNDKEISDFIVSKLPSLDSLFKIWDYPINSFTLTTVGIAIAISVLRQKCPSVEYNLKDWLT